MPSEWWFDQWRFQIDSMNRVTSSGVVAVRFLSYGQAGLAKLCDVNGKTGSVIKLS